MKRSPRVAKAAGKAAAPRRKQAAASKSSGSDSAMPSSSASDAMDEAEELQREHWRSYTNKSRAKSKLEKELFSVTVMFNLRVL